MENSKMNTEEKLKCFVIMPFSTTTAVHTEDYWNTHYEKVIKPAIESNKTLKAYRSAPLRGDVLRQIITDLVTAPIVVAELTDMNANVFWELGVRQSFKHCTITIAEEGFKLPFDLHLKATIFYSPTSHIKHQQFITQFQDAIDDCLHNPESPDSHVLETIGGRGTLFQILMKQESLRKLDSVLGEIQRNMTVFDSVKKLCEENANSRKQNPIGGITVETARLRTMSLESLIVNRYIDASDDFYRSVELCLEY
jgi:hypothetical protein